MARHRPLLIGLLLWALVMIVPDLARVAQPLGSFGFYANNDGLIYDVAGRFPDTRASPAWKAGLRQGDRIELARMRCFPYDAATFLAYYLAHDSHHRGQIVLLARLLGHPVSQRTMSGMW